MEKCIYKYMYEELIKVFLVFSFRCNVLLELIEILVMFGFIVLLFFWLWIFMWKLFNNQLKIISKLQDFSEECVVLLFMGSDENVYRLSCEVFFVYNFE